MYRAIVCVWMPQLNQLDRIGMRILGVGHAAIRLFTEKGEQYITWSANGHPLERSTMDRDPELGTPNLGFERDKGRMRNFFGQKMPDYTVDLPRLTVSQNGVKYGVNLKRIKKFWKDRLEQQTYRFFSKTDNCTGCVAEALKAGGLGYFADLRENPFAQDARSLRIWAQQGFEKLEQLNNVQTTIDATMNMLFAKHTNCRNAGVPTLQEWVRDSDSNVKFQSFAQRKDQIAKLDVLIRDYPTARTDLERFGSLIKMQSEVYSHFSNKPNSDRKDAVSKLGARVTGALRRLNLGDDPLKGLSDDEFDRFMTRLTAHTVGV
jgi:hypothetical protein